MTDDSNDEPPDGKPYRVGYGKPPRATRFRPGQSGNPKGRPRRPSSIRERFARELERKVPVREGDRVRKVKKIDLWVRRVIADAIKGDHRASHLVLQMSSANDEEIAAAIASEAIEELSAEDRAILGRHLALLERDIDDPEDKAG